MNAISQEQYETFNKNYQLLYKQTQIRKYDVSDQLKTHEFERIRKYGGTGLWYSEKQRLNQDTKDEVFIVRKDSQEVVKQLNTLWEVVDFINNEMPCDLLEGWFTMSQEEKEYNHYFKRAMQLLMNSESGKVDKSSKTKKSKPNKFDKDKITQLLHKKK